MSACPPDQRLPGQPLSAREKLAGACAEYALSQFAQAGEAADAVEIVVMAKGKPHARFVALKRRDGAG